MADKPKTPEEKALVKAKAAEIKSKFEDFLKGKTVCGGDITLGAYLDEKGYVAVLKVERGSSKADLELGTRVLIAYYDEEKAEYRLKTYTQPVGRQKVQHESPVGWYSNVEELMRAVADEVAKLG